MVATPPTVPAVTESAMLVAMRPPKPIMAYHGAVFITHLVIAVVVHPAISAARGVVVLGDVWLNAEGRHEHINGLCKRDVAILILSVGGVGGGSRCIVAFVLLKVGRAPAVGQLVRHALAEHEANTGSVDLQAVGVPGLNGMSEHRPVRIRDELVPVVCPVVVGEIRRSRDLALINHLG